MKTLNFIPLIFLFFAASDGLAQDTLACLPKTGVTDKKLNMQVAKDIRYNNDELFNTPMSMDKQYTGHHSISKEFVYSDNVLGGRSARGRTIHIAVRSTKKNTCAVYRYMVIEEMQTDGTYGYPKVANRITQVSLGFSDNVKKPENHEWGGMRLPGEEHQLA
jgi:hypothetical protein